MLAAAVMACMTAFPCAAKGAAGPEVPEPTLLDPPGPPLPGTERLTLRGDIASNLVAGVSRFLDAKLAKAPERRTARWRASLHEDVERKRARLARILGAVEERSGSPGFLTPLKPDVPPDSGVRVEEVRWNAFGAVHGEGLLLSPVGRRPVADVIALPDADLTPEQLAGLEPGVPRDGQFPRRLAEAGCRVVVPLLIHRRKGEGKVAWDPTRGRNLSDREYLHRPAFELGRTLAGYEVLKILAAADALAAGRGDEGSSRALGIIGWGEGGRLALYAAALDPRFKVACVSGAFGPREALWQEPLDRNLFGVLNEFGDAEVAALIHPRALLVEAARGPELVFASDGGAPGRLASPAVPEVRREVERALAAAGQTAGEAAFLELIVPDDAAEDSSGPARFARERTLRSFLAKLGVRADPVPNGPGLKRTGAPAHAAERYERQRSELDAHTQRLLVESPYAREAFMKELDTSSPEAFRASREKYRRIFEEEVIGRFEDASLPFNARTRRVYDAPLWTGYEVVLDVFPDVFAYGLLLVPKDVREGERRPVVVCQHGLEGRPQHTIGRDGFQHYSAFAARLAERGFVTFAPQNLYIFRDRFRELQRKANPLGKTLFSIITPQHRQIVKWLQEQPFVDPGRIAFYGLSYGGKTAMRVPPLVDEYCLSICSADFNEWVWKNASTRSPYSYVWTGEYEIFEWDLGHTFNYAEMAALIAPRPFMVERGHFDGVAPDETVAHEFAKVRHLYAARLGLPPETCRIEWFVGPHQIHGVGTFEFLHHHLDWPEPGRGNVAGAGSGSGGSGR